jgi:hypothetical protein
MLRAKVDLRQPASHRLTEDRDVNVSSRQVLRNNLFIKFEAFLLGERERER